MIKLDVRTVGIALFAVVVVATAWWLLVAPVTVETHTVATGSVVASVLGTGTLEARTSAVVGPTIGGRITHVTADQGDRVKEGSLLFRLEDNEIRQQVGIAEAEVAATTATLERLRAAQRGADAVLDQARTSHERTSKLTAQSAASVQDLDKALEALLLAEAEASMARAAIIEGQRRLDATKLSLEYHRARLQDTTVEAPFDALVVRRDRETGDVVAPMASVFAVVSTDEMWITAWVDETELARIRHGQSARVVFRSEPNVDYPGVVARVGREADRETREIVVDVSVDRLPDQWAIGQRAEVYIEVERREIATTIPARLIVVRDEKTRVMVNEGGRARWREVTIGLKGREVVEITEGLSPGDVVVSSPDAIGGRLRAGRRIRSE